MTSNITDAKDLNLEVMHKCKTFGNVQNVCSRTLSVLRIHSLKLVNSWKQVTYKDKCPCIFRILNGNYHSMLLCIFSFLFIGQETIMWPANKCLQLMACTFVILSKWCFEANNILLMCNNHFVTTLKWKMANCFPELSESNLNMKAYLVIEW